MERAAALDAIDLESSRFLVAASNGATSLDAPVPTCPDWDLARLVQHLGVIYSRLALVVSARRTEAPDRSELPPAPDGGARLAWFAEQRTAMLAALSASADDTLVWNWTSSSPGPASFWLRRMAHETLIHRVDVELALRSEPAQGDAEISADTVSEFFEVFYPLFEPQLLETGLGGSLHLHATDVSGAEWTLDSRPGSSAVTREHTKADAALRGGAFDLACWIWGRLPTDRLETFGNRQIARRFQEIFNA